MKSLEEIMKAAELKAQAEAEKLTKQIQQSVQIEGPGLTADAAEKIIKRITASYTGVKPKKTKKTKKTKPSRQAKEERAVKAHFRLTYEKILHIYEQMQMKPMKPEYWFYENRKANPLLQVSLVNESRTCGTPIATYALHKREEWLASDNPPRFITEYRDLDKPSNQWTAGRLSQITELSISYILGYKSGFGGNPPGHPNCSKLYHLGYGDGKQVRDKMLDESLLEPDPVEDIYADETDEVILSELHRCLGYQKQN
jgi:hypothetical protein